MHKIVLSLAKFTAGRIQEPDLGMEQYNAKQQFKSQYCQNLPK